VTLAITYNNKHTMAKQKMVVKDITVRVDGDFICLTDIAKSGRSPSGDIIKNYLRNRNNIEFLGLWEQLNNESFNSVNYTLIRTETGLNDFVLSVKEWITRTNAKGITSSAGRYGGTYAHKEIAYQFATWLSPSFYLYLIKEFDRLKNEEAVRLGLTFDLRREITKANYPLHTDAIKKHLIGTSIPAKQIGNVYASEADLLNVVLFGCTAKQWKLQNPKKKGNIRDYATIEELMILANIEFLNGKLISWDCEQEHRAKLLTETVKEQMKVYNKSKAVQRIKENQKKIGQ